MIKNNFEFEVLVNGKPVQEYFHEGLTFVEGKESTEFAIRMKNNGSLRGLFVPTIDGLSVMDGKEASFKSSGYIIDGHSSETIDGWRISDSQVAKFFFAKIQESYAAKTGKDGNVGVIGCAVFVEKEKPPQTTVVYQHPYCYHPYQCRCFPANHAHHFNGIGGAFSAQSTQTVSYTSSANSSLNTSSMQLNSASASAQNSANTQGTSLGTGFGEAKYSPVTTVAFERAAAPAAVFAINYNTHENLAALGVTFKKPVYKSASPFPKEDGYCQPPEGWNN